MTMIGAQQDNNSTVSLLDLSATAGKLIETSSSFQFKTDTEISAKQTTITIRKLKRWIPDGDPTSAVALEQFSDSFEPWDQFALNKAKFGVESSYDEHLYTTPIDKSHPEYELRAKKAEEIASEILGSSPNGNYHIAEERSLKVEDNGIDEEDKYSSVKQISISTAKGAKYIPSFEGAPKKEYVMMQDTAVSCLKSPIANPKQETSGLEKDGTNLGVLTDEPLSSLKREIKDQTLASSSDLELPSLSPDVPSSLTTGYSVTIVHSPEPRTPPYSRVSPQRDYKLSFNCEAPAFKPSADAASRNDGGLISTSPGIEDSYNYGGNSWACYSNRTPEDPFYEGYIDNPLRPLRGVYSPMGDGMGVPYSSVAAMYPPPVLRPQYLPVEYTRPGPDGIFASPGAGYPSCEEFYANHKMDGPPPATVSPPFRGDSPGSEKRMNPSMPMPIPMPMQMQMPIPVFMPMPGPFPSVFPIPIQRSHSCELPRPLDMAIVPAYHPASLPVKMAPWDAVPAVLCPPGEEFPPQCNPDSTVG